MNSTRLTWSGYTNVRTDPLEKNSESLDGNVKNKKLNVSTKRRFFFERRRQFQLNPCWDVPPNARTSSLKRSLKSAKVSMLLRDFNSKWMMKSCVLYGLYVWCQWSVYVWICLYVFFCFLVETFVTGKGQRGEIHNLGLPFQGIFVSSKEGYMKGLFFFFGGLDGDAFPLIGSS